MTTCRLCSKSEPSKYGEPIKYSVRHYAHADCGLRQWGADFFNRLHHWQLNDFPYFAAREAGLAEHLMKRIEQGER